MSPTKSWDEFKILHMKSDYEYRPIIFHWYAVGGTKIIRLITPAGQVRRHRKKRFCTLFIIFLSLSLSPSTRSLVFSLSLFHPCVSARRASSRTAGSLEIARRSTRRTKKKFAGCEREQGKRCGGTRDSDLLRIDTREEPCRSADKAPSDIR